MHGAAAGARPATSNAIARPSGFARAMAVAAPLLGGALAFAGDYPGPVAVFYWIAPIPVLVVVFRSSAGQAALLGSLYGFVATGRVWLDFDVIPLVGRLGMSAAYVALHAWVFWTTRVLVAKRRVALAPWVYASCVVCSEVLRELPFTGQWWTIAATQVDLEWLRATAALGGSFLMSFLVALGSATVAVVLTRPRGDVFASALAAVATIGACVAWSAGHPPVTGRSVRVAAVTVEVPPNIAQRWYDEHVWLSADLWSVFERYEAATRKAAAAGAELVAWREYGLAVPGDQRERFDERVRALAEETDMVVVASFIDGDEYRNLALLAAPDGQTDLYAKQHLVPALESFWLEPGTRDYGWLEHGDLRIAVLICYDIDFGASVRKAARHGANLLVVPAADWPGIHERHPLQGSLRAAEHSIPLVRPARGLSVLIDAAGGIVASAPDTDTLEVILVDELALGGSPTAYTAAGNWVVVLAVLVLAASWVQQRRRRPPVNESL